jgi:GNAT superfamily N-acetyltransferase|tara:strand:- start:11 stop:478 length:468 start_codon:yes stop_codon:yes gene_type:complete
MTRLKITYQQEFLATVEDEVKPLLNSHWEEIALNKDKIKLNPDWEAYEALEQQGKLKIFTARDDGQLVGYFVVIVGTNLHYKDHLFASNDIIYLSPNHRKGFTGIKLVKFAEKCLKDDGVSVLTINTKVHQPFDKLMDFLKFRKIERVYSKYLGE